ncbi:MAG: C4-type zinc ribbon domain-containing protein [Treponema sp.]|jgi:predicted  nucleic acid-binding Zn-ribbon protein|nr:C4-type zinc ribbon domain-containing protein [Treponema sp.]MDR1215626.1 C4-type zinc ribbon domain-containing protein [Treponema sp.]
MSEIFDKLRGLQDILSERIKVEKEIEDIPRVLDNLEDVLARLKKGFIEKNQECEKVRASVGDLRNQLFEAESSREKAERSLGSSESFNMREYEILDRERRESADKELRFRKELQKEERRLLDLIEEIKHSTDLVEQQKQDISVRRQSIDEAVSTKQEQLVQLEEREQEISTGLDNDLLFKFDRIIRHKMGKGIVSIKGGVCTGCHMILPAQFANQVRKGEEIVFCPYCSRILYYEESDQNLTEVDYFDTEDAGSLADLDDLDDDEEDEIVNIDYEE